MILKISTRSKFQVSWYFLNSEVSKGAQKCANRLISWVSNFNSLLSSFIHTFKPFETWLFKEFQIDFIPFETWYLTLYILCYKFMGWKDQNVYRKKQNSTSTLLCWEWCHLMLTLEAFMACLSHHLLDKLGQTACLQTMLQCAWCHNLYCYST